MTPRRISLQAETYWYGHGAAHGNYSLTFEHYLVDEDRSMTAEDLFAGADWQKTLLDATVAPSGPSMATISCSATTRSRG